MQRLEESIDDVLAIARALDAEGLGEVIQSLRDARNTLVSLEELYEGGEELRQELLDREGGALTVAEAAQVLGVSPQEIEERRAAGSILAVVGRGGAYLYPSWQFDRGSILAGLGEVLGDLRGHNRHPLALLRFFVSPSLRLDNDTPLRRLRRGMIDDVRRAARTYGEQGAA
jgi:hypothetical protein